jgi:hypothetical protein
VDDADPKLIAESVTEEQVADARQPDRRTGHRREHKGIAVYEDTDPTSGTTHRKVFARAGPLRPMKAWRRSWRC